MFDRPRSGRPAIYSASDKQRIAAKACAEPPEGYARWTVALLTDEVVRDKQILSASWETVRTALHSHEIKPWLQKMWCVPKLTPEYVARVLEVGVQIVTPYKKQNETKNDAFRRSINVKKKIFN